MDGEVGYEENFVRCPLSGYLLLSISILLSLNEQ